MHTILLCQQICVINIIGENLKKMDWSRQHCVWVLITINRNKRQSDMHTLSKQRILVKVKEKKQEYKISQ